MLHMSNTLVNHHQPILEPIGQNNTVASTTTDKVVGYGRSFASFGEIVQGRLSNGEDFLITIPVDLWSVCELSCDTIDGTSVINAEFSKSKAVAESLLAALNMDSGLNIRIRINSEIPVGKGLSSSTADMLAVVRAFQEAFGVIVTEEFISRLFVQIEPHDALHYPASVAYNHRKGKLLLKFNYIPDFYIVAVDSGGELSTVEYNRNLSFSKELLYQYDALYMDLTDAFVHRDDAAIARCAHRSATLHVQRTGNTFLANVLRKADELDVWGVLATHSGTCGGFILPGSASRQTIDETSAAVSNLGHVFCTRTLKMLS